MKKKKDPKIIRDVTDDDSKEYSKKKRIKLKKMIFSPKTPQTLDFFGNRSYNIPIIVFFQGGVYREKPYHAKKRQAYAFDRRCPRLCRGVYHLF